MSAAVFAAAHLDVRSMVPIFVAGLLFGWAYHKTKTLWVPIAAHACQKPGGTDANRLYVSERRRRDEVTRDAKIESTPFSARSESQGGPRWRHTSRLDFQTYPHLRNSCGTILDSGGDMLELGVPFSDPLADGPTIQMTTYRALQNGGNGQGVPRRCPVGCARRV